jgi:hypothetical protein
MRSILSRAASSCRSKPRCAIHSSPQRRTAGISSASRRASVVFPAPGSPQIRINLGAAVELHYLDAPLAKRWRRIEQRNAEGVWGSVPITREQLERWEPYFDAPERAELDLFDATSTLQASSSESD